MKNPKIDPINYLAKGASWEMFLQASNIHHDCVLLPQFEMFPYPVLSGKGFNPSYYLNEFEILRLSTMLEF